MLFQKKVDRVVNEKKSADQFKETLSKTPLEKKDLPAMIIAALLVLLPAVLVVGVLFMLISYFFFVH